MELAALSATFLSASWYRVAPLRPALKAHARLRRRRFRGEVWYVAHDPAAGRFNRFTPAACQLLGLMDGKRTMDEVWAAAVEQFGDDAPSQDELIRLLSQLHGADLLHCEATPDAAELFRRHDEQAGAQRKAAFKNPFSIRLRLWDPDRFLERTLPYVSPFLGRAGAAAYALIVAAGVALAALHWTALTHRVGDHVLAAHNLLLLWILFPLVKLLHEMGHAYAVKAGGGEVHEMGIMLLVFTPVPYVDASAASGFRSRWRRSAVGAAGMIVELAIAAVAMLVWAAAEPGLVRSLAFNVMLIAGVSTLVFNVNPLLRLDGYYIFSDLIEVPNLGQRANQYWMQLMGIKKEEAFQPAPGERAWLLAYAPLSLAYRMVVMVAIVLYVASAWFFVGVVLAIWGAISMFLLPAIKTFGKLAATPKPLAALAVVLAFVCLVPLPLRTQTEGVVWVPEDALVRAGADGFVHAVLARPGERAQRGPPLVESRNPVLAAQVAVQEAMVAELEARLYAERFSDRVRAAITQEELERERAALDRLLERADGLVTRAGGDGRFVILRADDLGGRYVRKGELLGYVADERPRIVRAVVSQDDIDLVRRSLSAQVRLAESLDTVHAVAVVREVPAANDRLPSAALSSEGGGAIAADPRDPRGAKALNSSFQLDLALPPAAAHAAFGGRAHVRFVHPPEPLAAQWYRRARQLFLARFHV